MRKRKSLLKNILKNKLGEKIVEWLEQTRAKHSKDKDA